MGIEKKLTDTGAGADIPSNIRTARSFHVSGPPPTVNGSSNLRDLNRYCKAGMYGKK